MEQQQQSLFDASIIKLQQEQLRHGVEPRLLRFVLINNALRSLQGHMIHVEDEDSLIGIADDFQFDSSDQFFYNTFKNGSLSSIPLSPPTPVKMMKLDGTFSDPSPLVEFQEAVVSSPCSSQDVVMSLDEERVHPAACFDSEDEKSGVGGGAGGGGCGRNDKKQQNGFTDSFTSGIHLGKRSRERSFDESVPNSRETSKRRSPERNELVGVTSEDLVSTTGELRKSCKTSSLVTSSMQRVNGLNGLNSLYLTLDLDPLTLSSSSSSATPPPSLSTNYHHGSNHHSSTEDSDKESLTPSPIDFTNVDPTLYDFDTSALHVESTDSTSTLNSQHTSPIVIPPPTVPEASNVSTSSSLTATGSMPSSLHFSLASSESAEQIVKANLSTNTNTPDLDKVGKVSLLSADSTVLAAVPGGDCDGAGSGQLGKGGSCSMHAIVRAQKGEIGLGEGESEGLSNDRVSISNNANRVLPSSPERVVESDYLDEIDHIVNLLMT